MLRVNDINKAYLKRTIRPLYDNTQATPKSCFLDPAWDSSVDIYPGMAVMKTLGFTGQQVLTLVLAESLLITLLGGISGMLLATVASNAVRHSMQQYLPLLMITPQAYVRAAACMLALGLLAGATPAWQALRLNITTALRRS